MKVFVFLILSIVFSSFKTKAETEVSTFAQMKNLTGIYSLYVNVK